MSADILLSMWKRRHPLVDKILDGVPLILIENGRLLSDRMKRSRVNEDDILTAARELHGLERLDQVKFAVLERSGGISIVPK
jgi:Predicted membrane protein